MALEKTGPVHLRLTQDQMRRKTGSKGDFEGPLPACGNGSVHCKTDKRHSHVQCEACKAVITKNPGWIQ